MKIPNCKIHKLTKVNCNETQYRSNVCCSEIQGQPKGDNEIENWRENTIGTNKVPIDKFLVHIMSQR